MTRRFLSINPVNTFLTNRSTISCCVSDVCETTEVFSTLQQDRTGLRATDQHIVLLFDLILVCIYISNSNSLIRNNYRFFPLKLYYFMS